MHIDLTGEQQLLVDTTRSFLQAAGGLTATRAQQGNPLGYDADAWRHGAELGWTSLLVSEDRGGGSVSDSGLVDACCIARELGAVVAPGPFVPTNVVAFALQRAQSCDLFDRVLSELVEGKAVATFTPVPINGRSPVVASPGQDHESWKLSGSVTGVESCVGARWLLVNATVDSGADADESVSDAAAQFLIPSDTPGVTITPLGGLDLSRRFARVTFDNVAVNAELQVGDVAGAPDAINSQHNVGAVLQCAETVGALRAIFARTLDYLADRYSFGRPLNSYQALKHRCADNALEIERCDATTIAATNALATGDPTSDELVSIAKAFVGPAATEIIQDCVQLHGGIGVTWEHDLHLYLRRATINRMTLGDPIAHQQRVARIAFGAAA